MFVFKAAVVGAGTMGGQIAQTIAAAGIPVVLKDIKRRARPGGPRRGAQRHRGAGRPAGQEGQAHRGAGRRAGRRGRRAASTAPRRYDGFGDVDFVIEAVPERMEIKQAVFAELDAVTPGHAILASNTSSLSITEIGEATNRPDQVVGFHYFYPAAVMPLVEIIEGDDTSAGDRHRRAELRPGDQEAADRLRRGPGLRRQPHPQLGHRRDLARAGGEGPVDQGDRRGRRRGRTSRRWGPTSSSTCSAWTPSSTSPSTCATSYGDRFYVREGMSRLVAEGKLGAKTGGEGFYTPRASRTCPATRSPTSRSSSSCSR